MRNDRRRSKKHRAPRTAGSRRWRKRLWLAGLAVTCVATCLLWLAPAIVARTGLRDRILSFALSDFEGSVTVGSASLGWLSPLAARDVAAYAPDGSPLAKVKSICSEKSLLALLSDAGRPGRVSVEQPAIELVVRADGSNWEDALAQYLERPSSGESLSELTIDVQGAVLAVRDQVSGQQLVLDNLDATVKVTGTQRPAIHAELNTQLTSTEGGAGSLKAQLDFAAGSDDSAAHSGQAAVQCESLDLSPLAVFAARWLGPWQAGGRLSGQGSVRWSDGGEHADLDWTGIQTQSLDFRHASWPATDAVRITGLRTDGQAALSGTRLNLAQLDLSSDQLSLRGHTSVDLASLSSPKSWPQLLDQLAGRSLEFSGAADIPSVARMFPSTLRIRQGIQIQGGQLNWQLKGLSQGTPQGATQAALGLFARVNLTDLQARDGSDLIALEQPVSVQGTFRQTPNGPVVEDFACQSSFGKIVGSGQASGGSANLQVDLGELFQQTGKFFDWGQAELRGVVRGDLHWQRSSGDLLTLSGQLRADDYRFASANGLPWTESALTADLQATIGLKGSRFTEVRSASVNLRSQQDELQAELLEPVVQPAADSIWPLRLTVQGELATWLARLQPVVAVPDWQWGGSLNLVAETRAGGTRLDANRFDLNVRQLRARAGELAIAEPQVNIKARGSWDALSRRLVVVDATVNSSTVAFRAEQVHMHLSPETPSVKGAIGYRADLGRLWQMRNPDTADATSRLQGSLTGVIQASHQDGQTQVTGNGEATQLVYLTRNHSGAPAVINASLNSGWSEVWREPSLKVSFEPVYHEASDTLELRRLAIVSPTVHLDATGSVRDIHGARHIALQGTADYDLAALVERLRPVIGPDVQLAGKRQCEFQLHGPLPDWPRPGNASAELASSGTNEAEPPARWQVSRELQGHANFGWQSADVYGLLIGAGDLKVALADGVVRIPPLQIPVSEGKFKASSQVDLNAVPVSLQMEKGQMLENVRISPQMCRTWMKYITPLLADATRSEGRFSMSLDRARVPLRNLELGDVRGQLQIHSAQVGPGPHAKDIVALAQQIRGLLGGGAAPTNTNAGGTWMKLPEQQVVFSVQDGRVHHDRLVVTIGDVEIQTSGSVGFDESLDLVAQIPVQDAWIADEPLLSTMRGTVLRIPVQGTMDQPRLDTRVLDDLGREAVRGAAGRLLENELERGLRGLFGPRP